MRIVSRYLISLMCGLTLMTMSSVPAWAQHEPGPLVIFGDSLSDPGNFFIAFGETSQPPFSPVPDAPYDIGPGHHFTDGKTWVERLAVQLDAPFSGLPALARPGSSRTMRSAGRAPAPTLRHLPPTI